MLSLNNVPHLHRDWKRHKKWCGKTRDEVREKLIQEGGMVKCSDGTYAVMTNGPNRSFGGMGGDLGGMMF